MKLPILITKRSLIRGTIINRGTIIDYLPAIEVDRLVELEYALPLDELFDYFVNRIAQAQKVSVKSS